MPRTIDSVFISYRRQTSKYAALLVYKDLKQHDYDVFIDYESIDSGKFGDIILNQIESRRHFVVLLAPGCLDRTTDPKDWFRKEIEYAMEKQRNIVSLFFDGFRFENEKQYLTGKLSGLSDYNGSTVHADYFDAAMSRLRSRFLKQPVLGVIKPAPQADKAVVQKALLEADTAAEHAAKRDSVLKNLAKLPSEENVPAPTDVPVTKEVLGHDPSPGEFIQLYEMLDVPLIWKSLDHAQFNLFSLRGRRIILTNKRFILRELENPGQSFVIPRTQLLFAKIQYQTIQFGTSYQLILQLMDGREYSVQLDPETMRRVERFLPANE